MKHLDFTIDFETCALTANAAPMQVAIVPRRREAQDDPFVVDDTYEATEEASSAWPEPYEAYIDLRSCVVEGMDVDCAILRSLCRRFDIDLEDIVPHTSFRDCRTVILEAALLEAERGMAGKSTRANGIALPHQIQADPSLAYLLFPTLPSRYTEGREAHDALYDALRSTWYTWRALKTLRS